MGFKTWQTHHQAREWYELNHLNSTVNNVRTVSDTKRAFYTIYTRPVNSIYRRVVEELMVEMHLLAVNVDYQYDPIFALGVVTSFERFMQGYRPEQEKSVIFDSLCQALQQDSGRYRHDAQRLKDFASQKTAQDLVAWLEQSATAFGGDDLQEQIKTIANNSKFKYSRLFAIGLFTLFETADITAIKDDAKREELLKQVCAALRLSQEKVQKDLELYRSNLEKMVQAQAAMEDMLQAEKKKREQKQSSGSASTPSGSSMEINSGATSGY